jgi:hydroxyacylglutathione hydrolase
MEQIYPDLWKTAPEHPVPDKLPDLMMHAYLLVRDEGNVLFCRSEHHADHERIQALGGMTHHYLTHWHEAAPGLARIRQMFDSRLCCHRLAEKTVSEFGPVDYAFEAREVHLGDIEVIPTPGHTPGSTCFLFRSPYGKTYLFAGDMLFPSRGTWQAVVFEDGDKAALKESLAMLRGIEPDVVCSAHRSRTSRSRRCRRQNGTQRWTRPPARCPEGRSQAPVAMKPGLRKPGLR